MPWTISLRPKAQKDLVRTDSTIVKQIFKKLEWLEKNFDSITPQRLSSSLSDYYKFRVGDYRIIYDYDIKRSIIRIYRIEHRSKVYKI